MTNLQTGLSPREEARREEIINSAAAVFFAKGFSRTSMDDVISATGGSKRTLYKYFSSKEDLFFAVVMAVADRAMAGLDVRHGDDVQETLEEFAVSYLTTLVSPAGLALFRAVISEAPHLPQLGEAFLNNAPERISRALATYLRDQNKKQHLGMAEPEMAAEQFLALVRGHAHLSALLGNQIPSSAAIRDNAKNAASTFVHGAFHSEPTRRHSSRKHGDDDNGARKR